MKGEHYRAVKEGDEVRLGKFVREFAYEAIACNRKLLVLRNYQELPDANVGGDIDVAVSRKDVLAWRSIIDNVCNRLALSRTTGLVYIYLSSEIIMTLADGDLQVDLFRRLNWRGVDWIDVESMINRSMLFRDNIWIPHPVDECVISFCMSYLYGGFVKEKYLSLMSEQAKQNKDEVTRLMAYIFGKKTANKIVLSLIEKDVREISQKATKYRIRVLFRGFLRHPLSFIYTFFLSYYLDYKAKSNYYFGYKARCKIKRNGALQSEAQQP